MTQVQFQSAAKADLIEIWLKIAEDSTDRADEYIFKIQEVCELISVHPSLGIERPEIANGVHSFPLDYYAIYYEKTEPIISVLRIWHAARDSLSLS